MSIESMASYVTQNVRDANLVGLSVSNKRLYALDFEDTLLLLLDKKTSKQTYDSVRASLSSDGIRTWTLFEKNNEFFRSGSFHSSLKTNAQYKPSLSHYSKDTLRSVILLSPIEQAAVSNQSNKVMYYHPGSSHQSENIKEYSYSPIEFIRGPDSSWPGREYSKKLFIPKHLRTI